MPRCTSFLKTYHDCHTRVCGSQVNSDDITGIGRRRLPSHGTDGIRRRGSKGGGRRETPSEAKLQRHVHKEKCFVIILRVKKSRRVFLFWKENARISPSVIRDTESDEIVEWWEKQVERDRRGGWMIHERAESEGQPRKYHAPAPAHHDENPTARRQTCSVRHASVTNNYLNY